MKFEDVPNVIEIDDCTTSREAMFRSIDVALQWIDEGKISKARQALCASYCQIYDKELAKHDRGQKSLIS